MPLHANVRSQLREQLSATTPAGTEAAQLNNALRLLSKWRSVLIQNSVLQQQGTAVMQGPLKGLDFLPQSAEGCHIAKLLGCYEQPLQPYIEKVIQGPYTTILNIGCAEGYYAVGMARRMPTTTVLAHDLNPAAQRACGDLAQKNGVADRVSTGGLFTPTDFAAHEATDGQRVLVLCDIEGAEHELLDLTSAPALRTMDLIVESHECLRPGITATLVERFRSTHSITIVHDDGQRQLQDPPHWFCNLAHLDQLLATWEWRTGPTPWLVMHAHRE
jgi:hypothetical protein